MGDDELNERELGFRLVDALRVLPDVEARLPPSPMHMGGRYQPDLIVEAEIGGRPLLLIVEVKSSAFPRDVREAIWQLRNHMQHMEHTNREIIPFLVANAISCGARDTLRDENIGYFDMGGTLFVPAQGAYVFIDRPAPKKSRKIFDTIFRGQRARVLQAVFEYKNDWLAVKDVSEFAAVSPATASQTLSELERREWVKSRGNGPQKTRCLVEPGKLVDGWKLFIENQKLPKLRRFYVPQTDPIGLMLRLDEACLHNQAEYAMTGEAAAQAYTPHLTSVSQIRCRITPPPTVWSVLDELKARAVDDGWNLAIIDEGPTSSRPTSDRKGGINFAKPLQVYLDLLQGSGRSRDMAMHFRSEGLGL